MEVSSGWGGLFCQKSIRIAMIKRTRSVSAYTTSTRWRTSCGGLRFIVSRKWAPLLETLMHDAGRTRNTPDSWHRTSTTSSRAWQIKQSGCCWRYSSDKMERHALLNAPCVFGALIFSQYWHLSQRRGLGSRLTARLSSSSAPFCWRNRFHIVRPFMANAVLDRWNRWNPNSRLRGTCKLSFVKASGSLQDAAEVCVGTWVNWINQRPITLSSEICQNSQTRKIRWSVLNLKDDLNLVEDGLGVMQDGGQSQKVLS